MAGGAIVAELLEAGTGVACLLLAMLSIASIVAREKLISLYRLDRMVKALSFVVLVASVITLLIVGLFAFHIPTTPLWPVSAGWRLKGFVCTHESLLLPELRDKCPFLGLPELAMANYEAGTLWAAPSRFAVAVTLAASLTTFAVGLTTVTGLLIARRRKLVRWSALALSERAADPGSPSQAGGKVFISYRRADTATEAAALAGSLSPFFDVFLDNRRIAGGVDFGHEIRVAIRQSEAVFVLIGPDWEESSGQGGRSRLHDPDDYVRLEVRTALGLDIPVVPVIVRRARLPSAAGLPADIAPLARKNAFSVTDRDFTAATAALLTFVARGQMAA